MPVDEQYQHTFPIYLRTYETDDDVAEVTVLADAPNSGDVVSIPELYVCGRQDRGDFGDIQLGGYTLVNTRGAVKAFTETESKSTIGVGGLLVKVVTSGSELHLLTTGLAGVIILWGVYWRAIDFPAP